MDNTCAVEGCDRPACSRGYCQTHYKRMLKTGDPGPPIRTRRIGPAECIVEGCDRPPVGRGYCNTHYARWRAGGDPGTGEIRHWDRLSAQCSVDDCDAAPHARGLCSTHHARWLKHGDPGSAELLHKPPGPCSLPDCDKPRFAHSYCRTHYRHQKQWGDPETVHYGGWLDAAVGYKGMHSRLQCDLSRADSHECRLCNKPAHDWAYAYTDPDVQIDPNSGRPFSTDNACYIPLCSSCHKKLDRLYIKK